CRVLCDRVGMCRIRGARVPHFSRLCEKWDSPFPRKPESTPVTNYPRSQKVSARSSITLTPANLKKSDILCGKPPFRPVKSCHSERFLSFRPTGGICFGMSQRPTDELLLSTT